MKRSGRAREFRQKDGASLGRSSDVSRQARRLVDRDTKCTDINLIGMSIIIFGGYVTLILELDFVLLIAR